MEQSKGHVAFRLVLGKQGEIFRAPSGDYFYAPLDCYVGADGYRVGGRFLGTPAWFEGFKDKLDLVLS